MKIWKFRIRGVSITIPYEIRKPLIGFFQERDSLDLNEVISPVYLSINNESEHL